ncbi:MFS transporter [Corynebacterium phoceense]|uniref:MFS transporter n=1 Tax=Corynebacterium phoceense TaxID=1686286 RepID=UPI003B967C14
MCAKTVVLYMNTTMVSVTLPSLSHDVGASASQASWIVSAYNVAFLAVLLPGGLLRDRVGHRLLLLSGIALFLAAAVQCAFARSPELLILGRAGIG